MSNIAFRFWQDITKLLVGKTDGTYAERVDVGETSLGYGELTADAWGVQKVSLPFSRFHGMFTFDVPPTKWMMYENAVQVYTSTVITSTGGAGRLRTSAAISSVLIESRTCPRYQPNRGHLLSTAAWMPDKLADGVRELGLGNAQNSVVFRLKSDGLLYAVLISNSVQTYEQVIDTSRVPGFNVEKGNIYDIQFQWRGVGNYFFYINNVKVHTVANLGTLTSLSIQNPAMPARIFAQRTTEDVEINVGCVDISSENGSYEQLEYGSAYATAVPVTSDSPVIIVRQPLLIGTEVNTRDLTLARISFTCSKKGTFKVWSTRDPSLITGATFKTVNQGSYVETDSPDMNPSAVRATAVTLTGMRFITAVPVQALVPREVNNPWPDEIKFPIVRGDYIVVTCTAATAEADVVIEWGEHI